MELKNPGLISASSPRPDNTPVEFPAAADSQPVRICAHRQLSSALQPMKEIGQALGINESRISQI